MSTVEIKNPGSYQVSSQLRTLFVVLTFLGFMVFVVALLTDPKRAWSGFVLNHFYFMSLALGGVFFASLQWLTGAMWSAPVRRVTESLTAYLPFVVITSIVMFFGIHNLFHWSHDEVVQSDPILLGKSGYLNVTFFIVRTLVIVGLWLFFAKKLIGNSILQDSKPGDYSITLKNKALSPLFIIVFALSYTVVSFDQIMSLDPHWFSTIFGVYCFAGLFYSTLALTCLITIGLKRTGHLEGVVNENHLHDLGKFMFAFTIFWAYIAFSQFMLIWYANMPEETGYYLKRFDHDWFYVSIFLLVGKFIIPFFALLTRGAKRSESRLVKVAIFMLFAQFVDVLWLVEPEFFKHGPQNLLVDLGIALGFIGVFGLFVSKFLSKHNVLAVGDPRLAESVHHHHQ